MKKCLLFLIMILGTTSISSYEKHQVFIGVGIFDILRQRHRAVEARIEYQPPCEWYTIRPLVGFMASKKHAYFIYGGFSFEWLIKKHLLFSPSFTPGYYHKGHGKDLGYPLEFKSGFAMAWDTDEHVRIGAQIYHMSNAHLGHRNPGEESIEFFIGIPF